MDKEHPIGVLDSGLGGVSVLRALREVLPKENYLYFGDSANAPYGVKTEEEILNLSLKAAEKLIVQGVKALVIACNTITGVAATVLREKYGKLIVVGTEPAVKPAVAAKPRGTVMVMATTVTLEGERFQALLRRWRGEATIIECPCPGLMEFVEQGEISSPALRDYLTEKIESCGGWDADSVVLGCTHYPFVQEMIRKIMGPHARFFDGALGIARQTERRLAAEYLLSDRKAPGTIIWQNSSADARLIALGEKLLAIK